MSYEILEHSADEKFRAEGESMEEAFSEAVKAFAEIVGASNGRYTHNVKVESESHEALLYDFLDQLVFLQDTRSVAVTGPQNVKISETAGGYLLRAEVKVEKITPGSNFLDIKAPTYNEMKVEYNESWVLEAVLDV